MKGPIVIIMAIFLCLCSLLYGQSASGALFSDEIQGLEKKLSFPLEPEEKNRALRELARLLELSGSREGAARAWNEAALALPTRDYDAFLRCSVCLAAMGEFENAAAAARAVALSPDADEKLRVEAVYLGGQIEAFRTGNTASLAAMLKDSAFAVFKPGIYYSIWKVSGDTAYRTGLLAEFPGSPEALALKDGTGVNTASSALWLLGNPVLAVHSGALNQTPLETQAGRDTPAAAPVDAPPPDAAAETLPLMLQTGLFGREENAQALAEKLRGAGFAPVIALKTVDGAQFWTVGVPPGPDQNLTILRLKDAGFESFPVY